MNNATLSVLAMVSLRNGSAELFRHKPKSANVQEFHGRNSVAMKYGRPKFVFHYFISFSINAKIDSKSFINGS